MATTTKNDSEHARGDCECAIDLGTYLVCAGCAKTEERTGNGDESGFDPFVEIERLEEEAEGRA